MKPMSIDELIDVIRKEGELDTKPHLSDQFEMGEYLASNRIIELIEANRLALEAGMQGVLRFWKSRGYWHLLNQQGNPTEFYSDSKGWGESLSEITGLTAEFVEPPCDT